MLVNASTKLGRPSRHYFNHMARKTYELSAETIKVLNGQSTKVAEEFGCDPSYMHGILAKSETDPFAKFEWLYAAAVRAGCDVSHWLNRLDAIRAKYYRMEPKCLETETAKFVKESTDVPIAKINDRPLKDQLAEVTQALKQGEILRDTILDAINAENGDTPNVRVMAKEFVNGRNGA